MKGTKLAEQFFSQIIEMKPTRMELVKGSFVIIYWGKDITETLKTQ